MSRPKKDRKDLKKIQMEMPPKSVERLKKLQETTEAASYAEVVRNALRLYEAVIQEIESGHEILIKQDGKIMPYKIFC